MSKWTTAMDVTVRKEQPWVLRIWLGKKKCQRTFWISSINLRCSPILYALNVNRCGAMYFMAPLSPSMMKQKQ